MKLGELKQSLAKLPPDMDDMQVLLVYAKDGKPQLECLAFTGYIPTKGSECVAIGGMSEVQRRVEAGLMTLPKRYDESLPPEDNENE